MNGGEEVFYERAEEGIRKYIDVLRENALSERRYILKIARERIPNGTRGDSEYALGWDDALRHALAIIDELINDPNV